MKKIKLIPALIFSLSLTAGSAFAQTPHSIKQNKQVSTMNATTVHYKTVKVQGLNIFYREAGDIHKPTILFLHGFPSSSHMFRDLINDLSGRYHLVAPDYPGFGQSSAPTTEDFEYSFDQLATIMEDFIDALELKRFSLYLQDYGGPVGFRIAVNRPGAVQSLIIQNANAYTEGLGEALQPLVAYIQQPNAETEKAARGFLAPAATRWQYTAGAVDASKISPDSYITDQYYLDRPGNDAIQLALFRNYGSNLPLYEVWQNYFRKYQPPTLVISGKNDPLFLAAGAEAFKKDIHEAQISLLDGGHFVLEEKHAEAAALIHQFLLKQTGR